MAKTGGITKVSGVTYENCQRLIARLAAYSPELVSIALQQDKANLFDPLAVASIQGMRSATFGFIRAMTGPYSLPPDRPGNGP